MHFTVINYDQPHDIRTDRTSEGCARLMSRYVFVEIIDQEIIVQAIIDIHHTFDIGQRKLQNTFILHNNILFAPNVNICIFQ